MYDDLKNLIFFTDFDSTGIITELAGIDKELKESGADKESVAAKRSLVYKCINKLLKVATDFNFNGNLWHDLISYSLISNENPFSLTCELTRVSGGSAERTALHDFKHIYSIFNFDFTTLEKELDTDCFSLVGNYEARKKSPFMVNEDVGERVRQLAEELEKTNTAEGFMQAVVSFYSSYGVGLLGLNRAFRIENKESAGLVPVGNMDKISFGDLTGYEYQRQLLIDNTNKFINGEKANNVLLYGDSGTGKSASIKALANMFYAKGLRLVEAYRHQYKLLPDIIALLKKRNLKFIIYLDDLSFEENETEYKLLKAVIEGGVETRPDNILIYATSNRRHLVKESWSDRSDMEKRDDIHRSDSVEEKLSLYNRFGLTINYGKPDRAEYQEIVRFLAAKKCICLPEEELLKAADVWALRHGGMSGRSAAQFVNSLD